MESSQQQHIELLSKSLKQAQDRYETCSTALAEERRSGRHRHEAIVAELSSVVTTCEQAQQETERWRDESEVRNMLLTCYIFLLLNVIFVIFTILGTSATL